MYGADRTVNTLKLISLSLINEAGYSKESSGRPILLKREMGAHSVIYPIILEDVTVELIADSFDKLIDSLMYTEQAKHTFYYYLIVSDSNLIDVYISMIKNKLKECIEKGVLCEAIYVDQINCKFSTISGNKIPDRKTRTALQNAMNTLIESDPEESILKKSQEYIEIQKEMKPIEQVKFINPATILIFINILIFSIGNLYASGHDPTIIYGIQDNALITKGQIWRLITSMFLHADLPHLFGNMVSLYFFGHVILPFYSKKRFVILYFLSGIAGNILSYFFLYDVPSLGASGAIMGVGGLLVYSMFFSKKGYLFRRRANYLAFAFMIAFNLVYGLFVEGIDNYGHFGGFIAGFLIAWFFASRNKDKSTA